MEYDYSDSVEQGNVISQSPSANASASEGDTVTITVSQGKKVSYAKMPNVIGLTEDAAKQAIKDQGLVPSSNISVHLRYLRTGNGTGFTIQANL